LILDGILGSSSDLISAKVFDAVAAELAEQEIWISLDNHVSKAQWCCGADDGNTWFGGRYL
jgi:hypothetical protein